ncbi:MAG: hypothetical protein JWQ97_3811 [Phenylobacterium sp.]|nr:hypothetical protein [Phenylobacterium sp.]
MSVDRGAEDDDGAGGFRSLEEAQAAWRSVGLWSDETLPEVLTATARAHPDVPMVLRGEAGVDVYPLSQVHALALKVAAALATAGIGRGDVVAVQLPNSLENSALYQGILIAGAVLLPLSYTLGPADLTFILSDSSARMLFVPDHWRSVDYGERVARLGDLPDLGQVVMLGEVAAPGTITWGAFMQAGGDPSEVSVGPDDLAVLMYTSGTTSHPKGVMHTSRTLLAEFRSRGHFKEEGALLSPWPTGHLAGTLAVLTHGVMGLPSVLMDKWDANAAVDLIEAWQVGGLGSTPFHLSGMLSSAASRGKSLASLKAVRVGATNVPEALMERATAAGVPVVRSYGSTEHPTATQCVPEDTFEDRLRTDGRPFPETEVRIVDDDGRDVALGGEGEVVLRGAELFVGYLKPELNEGAFLPGGWFRTGDIGRLDSRGFLTITDRKKDIIIRGGQNISSREVEDLLMSIPCVADAAAIAIPDSRLGERICAVLVLEPGAKLTLKDIDQAFQKMGVARQKTPQHLELREQLPRTPSGKVKKADLRAEVLNRRGAHE